MTAAERLNTRLSELRETQAFRNYLDVRTHVLRFKDMEALFGTATPSLYWQEELAGFEYMLDASPLVINKLLHHSYHLTGIKVYDYRTEKNEAQERFAEKLAALADLGGADLLVPQPKVLGGFGFIIDGQICNIDTLKFFEFLIGLKMADLLPLNSANGKTDRDRQCVLEIGAGWGGFAHAYKTIFPETTYAIIDLPEVLLFSGVYLKTLFPDARVYFYDPVEPIPEGGWSDYDFVLLPHTALSDFNPDRLDLTLNMVSFQEMTVDQCRGYVSKAHELGCPAIYSLNRDRGPYNPQMTAVPSIIAEFYNIEEVSVLDVPYTKMLPTGKKKSKPKEKSDLSYKHIAGRLANEPGSGKSLLGHLFE